MDGNRFSYSIITWLLFMSIKRKWAYEYRRIEISSMLLYQTHNFCDAIFRKISFMSLKWNELLMVRCWLYGTFSFNEFGESSPEIYHKSSENRPLSHFQWKERDRERERYDESEKGTLAIIILSNLLLMREKPTGKMVMFDVPPAHVM